jgi:four helix bundle protein
MHYRLNSSYRTETERVKNISNNQSAVSNKHVQFACFVPGSMMLFMSGDILFEKADQYAHGVYGLTKAFPSDERFGLTSQLRRSALSVPLNIVEGFARQSRASESQFLSIAYGSLKESQYLLEFAQKEGLAGEERVLQIHQLGDELGRLIWAKSQTLRNKQ